MPATWGTANGTMCDHPISVYEVAASINPAKTVEAVTLPTVSGTVGTANPRVTSTHIFAVSVGTKAPRRAAEPGHGRTSTPPLGRAEEQVMTSLHSGKGRRALALSAVTALVGLAGAVGAAPAGATPGVTPAPVAGHRSPHWVGTWAASPQRPEQAGFSDLSLRLIVHTSIGGRAVRIRLANTFGPTPLVVGAASVSIQSHGAAVARGTLRPLRFSGKRSVTIPAGGETFSDPVSLPVPASGNLAVSLFLPTDTGPPTEHADFGAAHQTSYVSTAGDHVDEATGAHFTSTTTSWFFLDGVDVEHPGASAVVALGDSITDGTHSSTDTNHRYPNWLADRLQLAGGPYAKLGVLDAGIGGNELLQTSACCGSSPSALDRLDRDVLDQSGVGAVIELLGTNDILGAHQASSSQVIAGLQELIAGVHARGLPIFGGTITPSVDFTPAEEQTREAVNQWIRTSGAFDGVIDFSSATADPNFPAQLNPLYDSGHLHPNDTGYHAMADAVDLTALLRAVHHRPAGSPVPGRPCLVLPTLEPVKPGAPVDVTCHPQPAGYTYDDTSPALSYSDSWTHAGPSSGFTYGDYESTESYSTQPGASVTLRFDGTGAEVVGPLGPNAGIADIFLDHRLVATVDTYAPWGKQYQQELWHAARLRPGHHVLTVVVNGTANPASSGDGVVIDAINVTPGPPGSR